jgi:hypothetical protein
VGVPASTPEAQSSDAPDRATGRRSRSLSLW